MCIHRNIVTKNKMLIYPTYSQKQFVLYFFNLKFLQQIKKCCSVIWNLDGRKGHLNTEVYFLFIFAFSCRLLIYAQPPLTLQKNLFSSSICQLQMMKFMIKTWKKFLCLLNFNCDQCVCIDTCVSTCLCAYLHMMLGQGYFMHCYEYVSLRTTPEISSLNPLLCEFQACNTGHQARTANGFAHC